MTKNHINEKPKTKFSSKFRMEAVRCPKGLSLIFSGIIAVEEFDTERIFLKSHGSKIEIDGKKLDITVFENNDMEVVGKIEGIRFHYGKD